MSDQNSPGDQNDPNDPAFNPPPEDEINNYDHDEDFPEYANDQNKELNTIIQEKVQFIHSLNIEIEEHQERLTILLDHLKSV